MGEPYTSSTGGAAPYHTQYPTQPIYVQVQPRPCVYITNPKYGPRPITIICPRCYNAVMTNVRHSSGLLAWLICAGCLIFGCAFGCCLIPFCIDDCRDCKHYCPNCRAFLGEFKRI